MHHPALLGLRDRDSSLCTALKQVSSHAGISRDHNSQQRLSVLTPCQRCHLFALDTGKHTNCAAQTVESGKRHRKEKSLPPLPPAKAVAGSSLAPPLAVLGAPATSSKFFGGILGTQGELVWLSSLGLRCFRASLHSVLLWEECCAEATVPLEQSRTNK